PFRPPRSWAATAESTGSWRRDAYARRIPRPAGGQQRSRTRFPWSSGVLGSAAIRCERAGGLLHGGSGTHPQITPEATPTVVRWTCSRIEKTAMNGWSGLTRRDARRTFRDRRDAGRVLAQELVSYRGQENLLVLGLARGGVPVGWEVAAALRAPLDVFVVRKLGVPQWQELAMGALATGGGIVVNDNLVRNLGISDEQLQATIQRETDELNRRESAYRCDRPPVSMADRTVILVDDGIATGASMMAAVR